MAELNNHRWPQMNTDANHSTTSPAAIRPLCYLGMAQYHLKSSAESKQSLRRALDFNLTPQLAADAKHILAELE